MLDLYRGTLSTRRLGVLVRQLPRKSALSRALNDGEVPCGDFDVETLLADLWSLWAKKEHPARAERLEKARRAAKQLRLVKLRSRYQNLKRTYGLGVTG